MGLLLAELQLSRAVAVMFFVDSGLNELPFMDYLRWRSCTR